MRSKETQADGENSQGLVCVREGEWKKGSNI